MADQPLFAAAEQGVSHQNLPAEDGPPGSASGAAYGGSRRKKHRVQYSADSNAGLIEISPHYYQGAHAEEVENFRQA